MLNTISISMTLLMHSITGAAPEVEHIRAAVDAEKHTVTSCTGTCSNARMRNERKKHDMSKTACVSHRPSETVSWSLTMSDHSIQVFAKGSKTTRYT